MDGYTLLAGGIAPLVLIPPVQKVRYDIEKDFVPLGLLWLSPQVLAVNPKLNIKTLAEFMAYAKANPGKLTVGSAGHRHRDASGERIAQARGRHRIQPCALSQHRQLAHRSARRAYRFDIRRCRAASNRTWNPVRSMALAITATERSSLLPDLKTTAELGFPRVQTAVWYGAMVSSRGAGCGRAEAQGHDIGGPKRSGLCRGIGPSTASRSMRSVRMVLRNSCTTRPNAGSRSSNRSSEWTSSPPPPTCPRAFRTRRCASGR